MNAKIYLREHSPKFIEDIIDRAAQHDKAIIDFFSGFGGVTNGMEQATKQTGDPICTVIACLNHDANAIESHSMNYPQCLHLEEDVREASTDTLKYMVTEIRKRSGGRTKICIWFSHECTHYSNAKGGDSRDADSRSLPEELERYIIDLSPDQIWIENVREFLSWGPLTEKIITKKIKGRKVQLCVLKIDKKEKTIGAVMVPIKEHKEEFYKAWKKMVIGHGFNYEHRILNCADYGCPTIRKRLFIQFSRAEIPIIWAKPTHSKTPTGKLKPWIPIKDCLELQDHGESLFSTKVNGKGKTVNRITSDKTFKRVYDGLITHIEPELIKQKQQHFMSLYFSSGQTDASVEWPSRCLTTKDRGYLHYVETFKQFVQNYYSSGGQHQSIKTPSGAAQFISKQFGGDGQHAKITDPAGTLCAKPHLRLVSVAPPNQFIHKYFNSSKAWASLTDPSWAITAQDRLRLMSLDSMKQFIHKYKNSEINHHSIDVPSATLTQKGKLYLATVNKPPASWLMSTQFNNIGSSLNAPCPVITANRKRYYVMNMQYANNGYSIEVPAPTLIAKMDKKPNYLISTEDGKIAIEIFKSDCEWAVKIKEWMARWGYTNIYMRELHIKEMLRITTIPEDYKMVGSKTDQKKFIGNAVPSEIVTALIKAPYYHNRQLKEKLVA